jgi:3-hydroxybutyryl-CoA dehydratase
MSTPGTDSGHPPGRLPFSRLTVGQELWGSQTITETHVVLAAGIFNDPGPNHVNRLQAEASRWGAPIVHGTLLCGVMMGVLGNALGSTIVAMLELSSKWVSPIYVGDTLIVRWQVTELKPKPQFGGGGIVVFDGEGLNQDAVKVMESRTVLAVGEQGPWDPAEHVRARRAPS